MKFKTRSLIFVVAIVLFLQISPISMAKESSFHGIVRVLLTKLQLTDRIDLSIDGSYSVGECYFTRGSKVTITNSTGSLILYHEGIAIPFHDSITFRRHQISQNVENGIRINGDFALHPGDLVISQSEGVLRAVLHVPIEEYLMGVVAHEMSDTFPMEALKAQAIVARTYAMSKIRKNASYDLTDSTNDQVYNGVQHHYKNVENAIESTKNQVGYYNGRYANCFYTASNGGQIELVKNVWNDGDYGYIHQKDDPYDLENHEAIVKRVTIPKRMENDEAFGTLRESIKNGLIETLQGNGLALTMEEIRLDELVRIIPVSPMHGNEHKVFTQLQFDVNVSILQKELPDEEVYLFSTPDVSITPAPQTTITTSWQPYGQTLSLVFPYFGMLERLLGLSINASDNEILTVLENDTAFTIESRRYGHGVGMSQRGAQVMAEKYGKTYEEILAFYYPLLTLQYLEYAPSLAEPIEGKYLYTPGPPATPTPRPTPVAVLTQPKEGEYKVTVTNIAVNSYLNLRQTPSLNASVLMQLLFAQELIVMEKLADGWLHVKTDSLEGYVKEEFTHPIE